MKKRIVLALVFLVSISMLISSFAHAQEAEATSDSKCSTAQTQYLTSVTQEIANVKALITSDTTNDERLLINDRLAELEIARQQASTQLDEACVN